MFLQKTKAFKGLLIIFSLVCLMLVVTGCNKINKVEGTVKIGVIAPLSGDAAVYGEQMQRVINYLLPKINGKYENKNVKFEFIFEDGKCTGNDATSAFQKLTDIDSVKFIVGGFCSSETMAIAPLATEKKILLISVGSSNPKINGLSPYVYSFSYSDAVISQTLADEMSKYNKVAIISEQNEWNIGIQQAWLKSIAKYPNVTVVADEIFPKGGTDFRSVLEKVKQAKPEAVLLNPNAGVTAKNLIKQLAEIKDWNDVHLFSQYAAVSEETLAVAKEKMEGMQVIDAPTITKPEFLSVFKEIEDTQGTLNDLGSYYTADAIDVFNVMTDLIVKYGVDPTVVRDKLISQSFKGYLSDKIRFENNSNFVAGITGAVFVVKDGKLEQQ